MKRNKSIYKYPIKKRLLEFPGGEIIVKGLTDVHSRKYRSIEALSLFTAAPRLNELGLYFRVPASKEFHEPHLMLYHLLQRKYHDRAFEQYNSLMKRLAKFCNQ